MNAAIITARSGSESIHNKSMLIVSGKELISYPITAARTAKKIDKIYISTDGSDIARLGEQQGCRIIWRPTGLCGPEVNHGDVIRHAVETVEAEDDTLKNVVVLLGNTVMVDGKLIDEALTLLDEKTGIDSVMSVWEAADDHPLRALEIFDGLIRPYGGGERNVSTARQSYPKAYFYDQGVWAFRKYTVKERKGPNPWWWMGEKCLPIIRPWVTGRDIHTRFDASISEWYLNHNQEQK